jgi:PAS domain S-box-containing protein
MEAESTSDHVELSLKAGSRPRKSQYLRRLPSAAAQPKAFEYSEQLLTSFFGTSTVGLAICDRRMRFLAVNDTLAQMNGVPAGAHIGRTMREILGEFTDTIEPIFRRVFLTGEPVLNHVVSGTLPTRDDVGHWIENYFPIRDDKGVIQQVGAVVVEITKQKELEQSLRALNQKLMRARDTEQQRIARELHDSLNQYHSGLKLNIGMLRRSGQLNVKQTEILDQSLELLGECIAETRTIARRLHPALLDVLGLESAARALSRDFSRRSGIQVQFKSNLRSKRLPGIAESTLFRVLQEALTNVQRHAESESVSVTITRRLREVVLRVRDRGRGISPQQLRSFQLKEGHGGLGLIIMEERLDEAGGQLRIRGDKTGTELVALLPVSTPKHTVAS